MDKKKNKSTVEIWKSIRKDPVSPTKIHKAKNRNLEDTEDEREMEQWRDWRGGDILEWDEDM